MGHSSTTPVCSMLGCAPHEGRQVGASDAKAGPCQHWEGNAVPAACASQLQAGPMMLVTVTADLREYTNMVGLAGMAHVQQAVPAVSQLHSLGARVGRQHEGHQRDDVGGDYGQQGLPPGHACTGRHVQLPRAGRKCWGADPAGLTCLRACQGSAGSTSEGRVQMAPATSRCLGACA